MNRRKQTRLAIAFFLLLLLVVPAGSQTGGEKLQQVVNLLQQRSYYPVDQSQLLNAAVAAVKPPRPVDWIALKRHLAGVRPEVEIAACRAAVASLGDEYSSYLSAREFQEYLAVMGKEEFGGTGLLVDQDERSGEIIVLDPVEGSPAADAGLRPGDIIDAIDGEVASRLNLGTARDKLKGAPGSSVALRVRREGQWFEVRLTRENISLPSVESRVMENSQRRLGYIRVRLFGSETPAEFNAALTALLDQQVEGLVLDLRNNGGGFLQVAVRLCSEFLPKGTRVVSVDENNRPERVYLAGPEPRTDLPLVVLINQHSASASEVTAAALKENGRAIVMGNRSFGKGSVQKLLKLDDGSAVKLTIAHYLTPTGRDIDGQGILPDIVTPAPLSEIGTGQDSQLLHALTLLTGRIASNKPVTEL